MELLEYKNENLEYTYYLKDGREIPHGLYRGWHKNGQLIYEHNYKDGKYNGLDRSWYSNGQLELEYNYNGHKRHGLCRGWNKSGRLKFETYWIDGIKYESEEDYKESLIVNKSW